MALGRTGRIVALSVFAALVVWWVGNDVVSWITSGNAAPPINILIDVTVLSVTALALAVVYFPHAARRRSSRNGGPRVSIRGNQEIRGLLNRVLVGDHMTAGAFRPALGFGGIIEVRKQGLVLWAGWGRRAGVVPHTAIESVKVTSRQEGLFAVPALEMTTTDNYCARFLVTDLPSGLFIGNQAETAKAATTLNPSMVTG